tara:strand:- start:39 stop:779 length:741 start_codon:yes stop_codon:yes gene_type:complete
MKVIILAGGLGTRFGEYTKSIPKPMIKIGKHPMLIHIMKIYMKWGHKNFYLAVGYKGEKIKEYFKNFRKNGEEFDFNLSKKNCKVTILDTGLKSMTGGRLKKFKRFLSKNENFMFTYGDGLANINLQKLKNFHLKHKNLITVTAVHPPARFGELIIFNKRVKFFKEKPQVKEGWINGGFFIAKKEFLNLIKKDSTILEKEPLELVTKKKQLFAYKHSGFWKCVDTKRDKDELDALIKKSQKFYLKT